MSHGHEWKRLNPHAMTKYSKSWMKFYALGRTWIKWIKPCHPNEFEPKPIGCPKMHLVVDATWIMNEWIWIELKWMMHWNKLELNKQTLVLKMEWILWKMELNEPS